MRAPVAAVEFASPAKRGFYGSLPQIGVPAGLFLATLADTPVFEQVKSSGTAKLPLLDAVREYPRSILLATGSMISTGAYFYVVNTYALSYAASSKAQSGNAMLIAVLLSALVSVAALPYFGALARRRGRRTMILIGLVAMTVWIFPTFLAIDSGNMALLLGTYVIGAVLFSNCRCCRWLASCSSPNATSTEAAAT